MSNLEGAMLSDYLLLQCISRGGVADVYRARQNAGEAGAEGNYEVAVKIFRPGYAQRESFREYFMTEAEKIGQFDHPNILPFLEFGEGEGLLYVVTPFVLTGTLDNLFVRVGGKFSAMQALPIMQQLCSAVQYAHDRDVLHGNIKPTNIFVAADGRMLLSDFGIARGFDDSQQSLTRIGWGSAEYAAPEQSLGVLRRSSDVYTLGVLLFRILTGYPPFNGQTPVEVLLKHVRQQPPPARSIEPSISDAVDNVLHIAMEKRSDDRFASAEEFSNALAAAVTVSPIASPVARSVPLTTHQLSYTQPQSSAVSNSHTPTPATIVFSSTPSVPPVTPEQAGDFKDNVARPLPLEQPVQQYSPSPMSLVEDTDSEITEIRKKQSPAENDDAGTYMFWSENPLEWSPIGDEKAGSAPLTATDYLQSKPMAPEVPVTPTAPIEKSTATGKSKFGNKFLPVLVVILLLIGLAGALLSTFLFPGPSSSTGTSQSSSTTSSGGGATAVSSPTHQVTASPTTQGKATATVVSTQPTPSPTLPPVPTNPPVPAFSCASGSMSLDGSANFEPTIQQLTNDYTTQCSGTANFTSNADGNTYALQAVASSNIDLAYSDLTSTGRASLVNYQVGALMYAVIVNSDTNVTNLTTAQLQGIYTGRITNWSQVGGVNEPIVIHTRPTDSAIRAIFESFVLKGTAQTVQGILTGGDNFTSSVARSVAGTSGAISYVPLIAAPTSGAQAISINGVSPIAVAVASNAYAFWSVVHLYSNQAAKNLALSFISFLATTAGTADLANNGVVPWKTMSQAALSSHIPGPLV